ncbi:MAG: OmpA family protein [Nitrospinae bacterium]|nr:OmpA family protein [Nitrospinota bacterium]
MMKRAYRWVVLGMLAAMVLAPFGAATAAKGTREASVSAISDAEAALKTAEEVNGQAAAPLEMRAAELALTQARQALVAKQYHEATAQAFEAMMKARVATGAARQLQAERQLTETEGRVAQTNTEIERLRRDEATMRSAIEKREQAEALHREAEAARRELESRMRTALEQVRRLTLPGMLFEPGKATLAAGAAEKLARIAASLKGLPIKEIIVEGHTDSTGSPEFNMQLSVARAETVRTELIAAGIAPELIRTIGSGPARPLAPNTTAFGRQQNRRVEIIVQPRDELASLPKQ